MAPKCHFVKNGTHFAKMSVFDVHAFFGPLFVRDFGFPKCQKSPFFRKTSKNRFWELWPPSRFLKKIEKFLPDFQKKFFSFFRAKFVIFADRGPIGADRSIDRSIDRPYKALRSVDSQKHPLKNAPVRQTALNWLLRGYFCAKWAKMGPNSWSFLGPNPSDIQQGKSNRRKYFSKKFLWNKNFRCKKILHRENFVTKNFWDWKKFLYRKKFFMRRRKKLFFDTKIFFDRWNFSSSQFSRCKIFLHRKFFKQQFFRKMFFDDAIEILNGGEFLIYQKLFFHHLLW